MAKTKRRRNLRDRQDQIFRSGPLEVLLGVREMELRPSSPHWSIDEIFTRTASSDSFAACESLLGPSPSRRNRALRFDFDQRQRMPQKSQFECVAGDRQGHRRRQRGGSAQLRNLWPSQELRTTHFFISRQRRTVLVVNDCHACRVLPCQANEL